jgi:hypothetical protein
MSLLVFAIDLILTAIIAIDTLGLVVASRKSSVNPHDIRRVCFIWASFIVLNWFGSCCGIFGTLLSFVGLAAKIWISLPKLGGADKLQHMIVNGDVSKYAQAAVEMVQSKLKKE